MSHLRNCLFCVDSPGLSLFLPPILPLTPSAVSASFTAPAFPCLSFFHLLSLPYPLCFPASHPAPVLSPAPLSLPLSHLLFSLLIILPLYLPLAYLRYIFTSCYPIHICITHNPITVLPPTQNVLLIHRLTMYTHIFSLSAYLSLTHDPT